MSRRQPAKPAAYLPRRTTDSDLRTRQGSNPTAPVLGIAVAAFSAPMLVYALTLAPTVTFEDSGAFIAVAKHLGVAHPPGYPLWCLLAHSFTWVPWGNVAQRVHLLSAVCAAGTACVVYLAAVRLTGSQTAALLGAWALGVSRVLWSQAVVAEVYTLNALLTMLAVYYALRWKQTHHEKHLYYLSAAIGLGAANHHLIVLLSPALLLWVLFGDLRRVIRLRIIGTVILILTLGLSIYLYLPIRSASDTPINWMPQGRESGIKDRIYQTISHIKRDVYKTGNEQIRQLGDLSDAISHSGQALRAFGSVFTWPIVAVSLLGAAALFRKNPRFIVMSSALIVLNVLILNVILKAEYNRTWILVHRVYYIPSHAIFAVWLSGGIAFIFTTLQKRKTRWSHIAAVLSLTAVVACALWNWRHNDRRGNTVARDFAMAYVRDLPEGSGIIPAADEMLFPCLYLKHVERIRPDVQILDRCFGWDGSPVKVVISPEPLTKNFIPYGLGYRRINTEVATDYANFTTLSKPPPDPPPFDPDNPDDPLAIPVRSKISAYHTRAGAKYAVRGQSHRAEQEFALAKRLASDAYSLYLLATVFEDLDREVPQRAKLLRRALEWYDQYYDRASMRYYPIKRSDILARLAQTDQESLHNR